MADDIYDKGYKRILSKKKNFLSLLKSFINVSWVQDLKEEDLEIIDKEFIPKDFKEKESDLIYKLKVGDKEVIFYFMIELQSSVDFTMPFRLLIYMVELYKRLFLDIDEKVRERANFRMPGIIPCILYNGDSSWTAVRNFKEYLNGYEMFKDHVIDFEYILLNVNQYTDEALFEINNLISSVFALDKKQDAKQFIRNTQRIAKMIMDLSADEQLDLKDWIRDVMFKKMGNTDKKIVEEIIESFGKGDERNMTYAMERMFDDIKQEGRQEGRQEEAIKVIRKMVKRGQSADMMAYILDLSQNEVEDMVRLISDHENLSDTELARLVYGNKVCV